LDRVRLLKASALAIAALAVAVPPAAAKVSPEGNTHAAPDDDGGFFLGHPTPTYQWHGCKLTSIFTSPRAPQELPEQGNGTKPKAVTFTYNPATAPYISWKVAKGYKICGAEVMTELSNPDVDSLLLGSAGYPSGKTKGSTSKAGKETIKVKIPKNGIGADFEGYEGKTYSMASIDAIAVFVKKKR
jgi:hypothetical protein